MTWDEAKEKAASMGGHLAAVTSKEENEWIRTTFREALTGSTGAADARLWLGASATEKGGEWKWVTGEPFEFQSWAKDKPDGLHPSGKPMQPPYGICLRHLGVWHDFPTTYRGTAAFLVEWDDAGK